MPSIVLPLAVGVFYRVDIAWSIPQLQGFNFHGGIAILPELLALTVGLSIYSAAFIAEIIRGGIQAVSRGQTDAAMSGLTPWQTSRLIVIPLALRVIVPPLVPTTSSFSEKLIVRHCDRISRSHSGLCRHGA